MRLGIIGTGWSGSSALLDLLKKTKQVKVFPGELSLMWDTNGIIDLYYRISENYCPYNVSFHLMEFSNLVDSISRDQSFVNPLGQGYRSVLSFKEILFQNLGVLKVDLNQRSVYRPKDVIQNVQKKLQKKLQKNTDLWCDKFNPAIAKNLISKSLTSWLENEYNFTKDDIIVFDQPCFVHQIKLTIAILCLDHSYVVKRSGNAILRDMEKNNAMIGKIKDPKKRLEIFNKWLLTVEESLNPVLKSKRVTILNFEEFAFYNIEQLKELLSDFDEKSIIKAFNDFNWSFTQGNV
jgi:hypothetical protein